MSRRLLALVMLVVALVGASPVGAAPAAPTGGSPDDDGHKVLVVTTPALQWADLAELDLPHLESFLEGSSVAMTSLRTIGARTGLGEGYLSMGTGNRASAPADIAGLALEPNEYFEEGSASAAFERRTGEVPTGALLHLGFPSVVSTNNRFHYGAEPGALGDALREAEAVAAVIANGDEGMARSAAPVPEEAPVDTDDEPVEEPVDVPEGEDPPPEEEVVDEPVDADDEGPVTLPFLDNSFGRSASLLLADGTGQVPLGRADGLLRQDPEAPFGVRYDQAAVVGALGSLWDRSDVVAVELSDLDRADSYRRQADREAGRLLWERALADSDELFGAMLEDLEGTDTTVIVVTPAARRSAEALGVFAMRDLSEPGQGGLAQSGVTRRAGYVTLADIGPTILDVLNIDAPSSMTGTRIATVEDIVVDQERFEMFADANERALFRNEVVGPISVVFVVAQILAYGLAAVAVARRRRWVGPVSFLALVILAVPIVVFASGALDVRDAEVGTFILAVFAASVVLAAGAEGVAALAARWWPRTRAIVAPLLLVGAVWMLLAVDITTGGRLQIDTAFGYSPIVAGRFAGFGNLAFALIAMSAAVAACGAWATVRLARKRADGGARLRRGGIVAMSTFLALTVVIDGAPAWGSDVGGVLATVPAFTVLVLVAAGARLNLRRAAVIGVVTVAVLGVFAAIDLSRAEESRTHLGRLVSRVADSDGGGVGEVLTRKITSNISILTSSIWTLTIPCALGLMVFLARRERGFLRELQNAVPGVRAMLAGGLLVAVLGFALNDSGVAVPAMMFAVLLPYTTYLILRWAPAES